MKRGVGIVTAVLLALYMTGCGAGSVVEEADRTAQKGTTITVFGTAAWEQVQKSGDTLLGIAPSAPGHSDQVKNITQTETEDGFVLTYQGTETKHFFSVTDCDCEYDKDGIFVCSKYISNRYWVDAQFPYFQYVLYIRTPSETVQIFPVKDFVIRQDTGMLYIVQEESDIFKAVRRIALKDSTKAVAALGEEILNGLDLDAAMGTAHKLSFLGTGFSNLQFTFVKTKEPEDIGILRGEASGIERATGERYYMEWAWEEDTKAETVTPCVLKVYDPQRDAEELERCAREFDRIEAGDWSDVRIDEEKEYLRGISGDEWSRVDVNGDGMPELISAYKIEENKKAIVSVFAYEEGGARLVYADETDAMEYYFIGANGALVYETVSTALSGVYAQCRFDEKWNYKRLWKLDIIRFPEDESCYSEEETARLRERYPESYGTFGSGTYFYRTRAKTATELQNNPDETYWVTELITKEEFFAAYTEMTGYDFMKENSYWDADYF